MKKFEIKRRLEEYRKRKHELELQRQTALTYKKQVTTLLEEALAQYRQGKLSYEDYQRLLASTPGGRTREAWISYYTCYIKECDEHLAAIDSEIHSVAKELRSTAVVNTSIVAAIIVAVTALLFVFGPELTGFVTAPLNVTVVNAAPNITSIDVTPDTPYTNSTMTCTITTEDFNNDAVTIHYRWFNNNTGVQQQLAFVGSTLDGSNFTSSNNITCQGTPDDVTVNGTSLNSSEFIENLAPVMASVEIGDHLQAFNYVVTPIGGQNASVAIKALVTDGDCSSENNLTAYVCNLTSAPSCSNTNFTYSKVLTFYQTVSTSSCYFTFNGSATMPQFWSESGGTRKWNITVVASDNSSRGVTDDNYSNFTYNSLEDISYPTRLYLGNESITVGGFSTNTTATNLTNFGNVNLSLQWNVSNPTRLGGGGTWTIDGTDFQLDDDSAQGSSDTLITFINLTGTLQNSYPAGGLVVCNADTCNEGYYSQFTRNETLETYFHIKPPTGLPAGTYSATIWIVINTF